MKIDEVILEEGKSYNHSDMLGYANMERLFDVAYFSYISFEPNKLPRQVIQHFEVSADVNATNYTIVRIFDCNNSPFKRVNKMVFKKEHALSLEDRARLYEGQ